MAYAGKPSEESKKLYAQLAGLHRGGYPDIVKEPEIRRQLAESRIRDHISAIVAIAPPLKPEQVDRIVALLVDASEKRERVA